ncbi:MAG: cytochrome c oxidase assembly factor Coa1 family protein [Terracidiphilus sp.]
MASGTAPLREQQMEPIRRRQSKFLKAVLIWFVLTLILLGFWGMDFERRAQEPAELATQIAFRSAQIRQALGDPLRGSKFIRGNLTVDKGNGNADLYFRIKGSSGVGTLYEWAQESAGRWQICGLNFKSDRLRDEVTLVDDAHTHCERE